MSKIRFDADNNREFPLAEKWTFAEIDYIERQSKVPQDEWTAVMGIRATILLSARRVDPSYLSWNSLGELSLEDVTFVADDEDENEEAAVQESDPSSDGEVGEVLLVVSSPTNETAI